MQSGLHNCFAVILFCAGIAHAGEAKVLNQGQKATPLEGVWQVCSASFQLAGPIYYTFRGNTLTIESRQAIEKRLDAGVHVFVTHWTYEIDRTKTPHRLKMQRRDNPKIKEIKAFEFRNGEIWMCRDMGRPITSASLKPGRNGCGWLTGLSRLR